MGIPHPFDQLPRLDRQGGGRDRAPSPASSTGWRPSTPGSSSGRATSGPRSSRGRPGSPASPSPTPTPRWRSASPPRGSRATPPRRPGCWRPLPTARLVPGRATYYVRAITPLAKLVQRARGERPGPARRTGGPGGRRRPAPTAVSAAPGPPPPAPPEREVTVEQVSLGRRLRQPRTIISIAVPLVIIVVFVALNWKQLERVPALILAANPLLVLAAFAVYYLGFPLRGYRWALLLRGTGFYCPTKDATEIIFLSWLVNCVVPAKLGDVYRAYLLKINSDASLSRTFGTVFIERVLDLFVIVILGLAAGFWSFRGGLPPEIQVVVGIGVGVMVVLALGLLFLRNVGRPPPGRPPAAPQADDPRALRALRGGRLRGDRLAGAAAAARHHRPDLDDRVAAALVRGPGARLPGRLARPLGGGLRRPDRVAADGRPAQPGRPRDRRGGDRRRPDPRLQRARWPRPRRSPCSTASSASSR